MIGDRRGEARLLRDLDRGLRLRRRPWPTTVLWRWRYPVLLVGALALGIPVLLDRFGGALLLVGALGLGGLVGLVPAVRRRAVARAWCLITPHRIRTGCAEAGVYTRAGRLPSVLFTCPTPVGERVLVWCPAGLSVEDLGSVRDVLRSACWAGEVTVARHRRHAQLALIDVHRRGGYAPVPVKRQWARRSGSGGGEPAIVEFGQSDGDTIEPAERPVLWSVPTGERVPVASTESE